MTATQSTADRTTPAGPVRVTVAVPTYRRPAHLRELLPMLAEQAAEVTAAGRHAVEVLVVDNDPDAGARPLVVPSAGLRYAAEPTPGIAAVRNRALDEAAGSRLLAFIDDDERPHPDWLARLLDTWERTGAAAVTGRVLADYRGPVDPWILAGGFFVRRSLPTGSAVDVAATNNLLLDLDQVREAGLRFEAALGLGGGEDTLFSRSLSRAGRRLVWCDEAVVVDQVPAERLTRRWVLARAWSHGNTALLTDLRLTGGAAARLRLRARGLAGGAARVAGGAARWSAGALTGSARHRARGLRALLRGAGMAAAALGVVYQEYARGGRRWHLGWAPGRGPRPRGRSSSAA
ncbi:glycosyltransferase family 2 protein [Geodermatophilus sp. SYSU D01045]